MASKFPPSAEAIPHPRIDTCPPEPGTGAKVPLIGRGDHCIIDLDGTLIRGGQAIAGAARLIDRLDGRYVIVSNNSRDLASELGTELGRLGLNIPPDRLVLAGEETIRFVAAHYPSSRCLIATSFRMRQLARREGLVPVRENADFVILGRDLAWSYARLAHLINELRRGAGLIVTNPDLTHPDLDGKVLPETGTLLSALQIGAGVAPSHIIGKPEPLLFLAAVERLAALPSQTIVIGDNPLTDQVGAERLGMRWILVHADRADGLPSLEDMVFAAV